MYATRLPSAEVPAVVVGVVGMGHVPGIEKNWEKQLNISEIMRYIGLMSTQVIYSNIAALWLSNSLSFCLSVCLSAQCRAPFASELDVSHRHEGRDGGDAGIHLLPGRREFRQSLAVSAHSPVFTDHTATTPLLSPAHPVYWSCLSQ